MAAAWARSGTLALVGGGYGELEWVRREYCIAVSKLVAIPSGLSRLGCGFITWRLAQDGSAFDWLLDQQAKPAAVMLSFGDPTPWIKRLADRGIPAICQIQRADQLKAVLDAGASIVVAQGSEAGGHGMNSSLGRGTFTLVPELADILAGVSPNTLLIAAGGISDGRGLAASLMLGADGAMIGSRAWATLESMASIRAKQVALATTGDETIRSGIFDILRGKSWPRPYDFRALRNSIHREWEGRETALLANPNEARHGYEQAVKAEDYDLAHIPIGECVGSINDIPSSAELITRIVDDAIKRLSH
ncbi:nitronate monooxygenase [Sphingorhabdus sp. YGSMI21]|uniref:NAD(P)H-dependent flavin oxidoreductase n=1 Tax=Sphingorhabdus sp. YGSMI21 TaxID=2077182 RepID=UPI001F0CDC4F|nr:nitronate monooxygenase [Sphingorhabdus sp. YGSMI21]